MAGTRAYQRGLYASEKVGQISAADDPHTDRDAAGESGDDPDGRIVEFEGPREVRGHEGVKSVGSEGADGNAQYHVQDGAIQQQRAADGAQLVPFVAHRKPGGGGLHGPACIGIAARRFAHQELDHDGGRDPGKSHHRARHAPTEALRHVATDRRRQYVTQGNAA